MKISILKYLIIPILISTNLIAKKIKEKPNLLIYSGITMVKPIKEISEILEKKLNINITINQGGSKDLYESLKSSQMGDLYLPGSESYRINNLKDGFLLDFVEIGYNQASIFVKKGNPNNIKGIEDLLNEKNDITICNPESGSIGKLTKKILIKYKNENFYNEVFDERILIGTDSRNLNKSIIEGKTNLTINWRATGFWGENRKYIDVIELPENIAPKKKLLLNLLSFSKNKEISRKIMYFFKSEEGKKIMKKYGFLK